MAGLYPDKVAAPHNLDAYPQLLKRDGTMTLVGAPAEPPVGLAMEVM
jgi:D-arabinose 1-dehydrogenase-like Zn-dependent alcohol dehydrogenase